MIHDVGNCKMKPLRIGRWAVEVDADATAAAYEKRTQGAPEECGCLHCRNFAAAREKLYPKEAIDLFTSLGIHPIREASISHSHESRPRVHYYLGFMHGVGRIVEGEDTNAMRELCSEAMTPTFSIGFTTDVQLVPGCFPQSGLYQVEFVCEVPWVIDEPYDGQTTN